MNKYRYAVKKEEPANELEGSPILTGLGFYFGYGYDYCSLSVKSVELFLVVKPSISP